MTNIGDIDLVNVFVDDPLEGNCDQFIGNLAVGEVYTYTCTGDAVDADYTNIAFVTGEPVDGSPEVSDNDPSDVVLTNPAITIIKDDADNSDDVQTVLPGGTATFTITVTNTGDVDLVNVTVSDPLAPNCDIVIGNLAVGETYPAYTCTVDNVDANFTNIADVIGDPVGGGDSVTDDDPTDVVVQGTAAITIDKHALDLSDSQTVNPGSAASFEIVVTNTGDVDLVNVFVDDPLESNCDQFIGSLAVGEVFTYTCTGGIVNAAYTNVAEVSGDPVGGGPQVSDEDPSDVEITNPSIMIVKDDADNSDDTQTVLPDGTATFTITVTNTGDVDLENVTVSDPLAPNCDILIGDLAAGATYPAYTCTIDNVNSNFTNIADVTGDPVGGGDQVTDDDPSDVVVAGTAAISIDKHALDGSDLQSVTEGTAASFEIVVTNIGDVDLVNVFVDDPLESNCDQLIGSLAVGEQFTYTCTGDAVSADYTNVADVTGDPVDGSPEVSDSDPSDVNVDTPSILIVKDDADNSDDTQTVELDGTATFTITVTNNGDVDLENVTVSDPLAPNCDVVIGFLAAGATFPAYTCTIDNVTEDFTNIATVIGDPVGGGDPVTDEDPTDVVVDLPASISVDKHALDLSDSQTINAGTAPSFEIVVTNTGQVALSNVFVNDAQEPACDQLIGDLAPGETFTYTCTGATVTSGYTNIADVTGDPVDGSPEVTDSDPSDVVVDTPSISIVKDDADNSDDTQTVSPGGTATFTITVTNTGTVDLENVTVTDPLAPGCDLVIGDLAAGATHPAYTCTVENVDANFTNIAFVTGDPVGGGEQVSDDDPTDILVEGTASISIDKHALDNSDLQNILEGGTPQFEIVVTNNGDVDLTNVVVSDALESACDVVIGDLAAGDSYVYECTGAPTSVGYTNVAEVTGDPSNGDPEVSDEDPSDVEVDAPSVQIVKDDADNGDDTQTVEAGGSANFTITITNTGNVDLENVTVSDPMAPDCDVFIGFLAAGDSYPAYTCSVTDVMSSFTNIATVTGTPVGGGDPVEDEDPSDVEVIGSPDISILKSATDGSDSQTINPGENATFEIIVTNTGDVDLEDVFVTDFMAQQCDRIIGDLGVGEQVIYTCIDVNVQNTYVNTAVVVGDPVSGDPSVFDEDPSDVIVPQPSIQIIKDDADNNDDVQTINPGGTANFSITVTNTGELDLENVTVSDPLSPGCSIYIGNLAIGESFTTYTCSLDNVETSFTNVAEVTADPVGGGDSVSDDDPTDVIVVGTPGITIDKHALDGADYQTINPGGTAQFEIVVTNSGDIDLENVMVTDPLSPSCDMMIGDLAIGESFTYTCDDVGVAEGYTNIAEVTGDPVGGGDPVEDEDPSTVDTTNPSLVIIKEDADNTDDTQTISPGGTATFTVTVVNNGNVDLTNVSVSDPLSPACDMMIGDLAVGEAIQYTCSIDDVTDSFTNLAEVTGDPVGGGDPVSDDDPSDVLVVGTASVSIDKHAADGSDLQLINPGQEATFEIVVTNTGEVDLENVLVTDPLLPECDMEIGFLAVGESVSYFCVDPNVQANYVNLATVVADPTNGDPQVSDEDDSEVDLTNPAVLIVKDDADNTDDTQLVEIGGTATFTITVVNKGNVDLENVQVSDPASPDCDTTIDLIPVGESVSYTCTIDNVTSSFINLAQVVADPVGGGDTVFDNDDSDVVVAGTPAISISKTAFDGSDMQMLSQGEEAIFVITVSNTGDVDLTNVAVSDPQLSACDMMIGDLAVGEEFTYICSDPEVEASYTNVAIVTADPVDGSSVISEDDSTEIDVLDCFGFQATVEETCPDGSDQFYNLVVAFNGGSPGAGGYTIVDNLSGETVSGIEASEIFGLYNSGSGYNVTVSVTDRPECSFDFSKSIFECEGFLAVEFLGLSGKVLEQGNELNWSTASEIEAEDFRLYRSVDGQNFEHIATKQSAGNSFTAQHYDYMDTNAPSGISYYKVVVRSTDGSMDESNVISLFRETETTVNVYPVPTESELIVEIATATENLIQVNIHDLTGRLVDSRSLLLQTGLESVIWDVSQLPVGMYFLSVNDGLKETSTRFVKK